MIYFFSIIEEYLFLQKIYEIQKKKNKIEATQALYHEFLDDDSYYPISNFNDEKRILKQSLEVLDLKPIEVTLNAMKSNLENKILKVIQKHERCITL